MASLEHCPSCPVRVVRTEHHDDGSVSYPDLAPCGACDHHCGPQALGFDPTCGMASKPASRFHLLVDVPDMVDARQAHTLQGSCERLQLQSTAEVVDLLGDLTELLIGPYATEPDMLATQARLAAVGLHARPHIH